MITYSIIKKSQIEGALRLDAEYYQPEYLKIRESIKKYGFLNLKDIIVLFSSGQNLRQTDDINTTKFIRTQNIRPIMIDDSGMSFTKEEIYPKLDYGDLLFVRVGEGVGNSSVVTKNYQNSTFSDNVIRIKIKEINPFYVSVLLNSKIGSLLMEQIEKGSARPLISRENLDSLKILKIPEKEQFYFERIINETEDLVEESKKLYSQAENLLLEELGLKDFENKESLFTVVNLSDVKKANRIDAEYFQLKYNTLLSKIKTEKLGDLVLMKKGIEPGGEAYQESGKLFIRVSSISKEGIINKDQKYLNEELYQKLKKNFEPKVGEILLTKDATPGIAYVVKESIEAVICSGILKLNVKKDIEPEYLAFCINSVVGKSQVERDAGGSIITHWKPEQIKDLQIPILAKSIQQQIIDLVIKSHEARKKAKELLEEAKQKVEDLIEKGQ